MINGHKISAFVITYNEEDNIQECLDGLRWADEVLVVDSYSDDSTVEIARGIADRVIEHEFEGHVGQTRFAAQQTSYPWIMWLDADERLTSEAYSEIEAAFESGECEKCAGFAFPRKTHFMGRWITHSGWYPQPKVRLWHRESGGVEGEEPHPRVDPAGPVKQVEGDILHYSYPRGMRDMVATSTKFAWLAAVARHSEGREWSPVSMLLKPPGNFLKKYLLQLGIFDGLPGFAIAVGAAYYRFMREVMMWELENTEVGERE
ncbi:MAG: glycosyltransferase family 2 protein [Planctomycetota bacterium]